MHKGDSMKGLELSKLYYEKYGQTMIRKYFPQYESSIAAGLVGMGSECFGFDDEISQDHDWGPSFCIWLNKELYEKIGKEVQIEIDKLPSSFATFKGRQESRWGKGRTGVFEIGQFYRQFIGLDHLPNDWREWRLIPEKNLATATNGMVFTDPSGEFTAFREGLKQFYPEDLRLKKIAYRCMLMAQSGQYNFMRCVKRQEFVAAQCTETEFINMAISMVFLLNKRYKPFYKWMHRALKDLPILGATLYDLFSELVTVHSFESGNKIYERKNYLMESICQHIIQELKNQGLSDASSDFLLAHGPIVQSKIQNPTLKSMNVWNE